MRLFAALFAALVLLPVTGVAERPAYANSSHQAPFANTIILVVRHAEKPDDGDGLTPAGQLRAQKYVQYFENYKIDGRIVKLDALYATADSKHSMRPRLTIEPLSHALGLPLNTPFHDRDTQALADALRPIAAGKHILICWHHGEIPDLLTALGADANTLVPGGRWPSEQYGWVIQLCYDGHGQLIPGLTRRVDEHLVLQ